MGIGGGDGSGGPPGNGRPRHTPALADPTQVLSDEIITLMFGLIHRSTVHAEESLIDLGLSPPQGHALRLLEPGRPVAQRQLAEVLCKDPSNLTTVLHQLEERGLIRRRVSAHDRRVRAVELTEAGEALREKLIGRMLDAHPAVAGLSIPDRRRLRDLLRQLQLHASASGRTPPR